MDISKKIQIFWENPVSTSFEMLQARRNYWDRVYSLLANTSEDLTPVAYVDAIVQKLNKDYDTFIVHQTH